MNIHISRINADMTINDLDEVDRVLFEIVDNTERVVWQRQYWGSIALNRPQLYKTANCKIVNDELKEKGE